MYDLILSGGTIIDPSEALHGPLDVAVNDGKIAEIAPNILPRQAHRVIDVKGRTVTPGLIDLHTHVFDGVAHNGVHPDLAGVRAGVTTVVDAGSSGAATFGAFPKHILPKSETEVLPFLHICQTGLATTPDIIAAASIDLDATLRTVDAHKGLIRGVKARMVSPALEILGMEMPRLAKRAARESHIPLLVHIGDTEKRYRSDVIRELLPLLEPGDIVTHLFTANPGGVLDANGVLVAEARELKDRGVWLDTAHGRLNFGFDVARKVLDQGLIPDCISTDLTNSGPRQHGPQPGRDDGPLPGPGLHLRAGDQHVHRQPGQSPGRAGTPGQPGRRTAGRHIGARPAPGGLGGLRHTAITHAHHPSGCADSYDQAWSCLRTRMGATSVGLGA